MLGRPPTGVFHSPLPPSCACVTGHHGVLCAGVWPGLDGGARRPGRPARAQQRHAAPRHVRRARMVRRGHHSAGGRRYISPPASSADQSTSVLSFSPPAPASVRIRGGDHCSTLRPCPHRRCHDQPASSPVTSTESTLNVILACIVSTPRPLWSFEDAGGACRPGILACSQGTAPVGASFIFRVLMIDHHSEAHRALAVKPVFVDT